MGFKEELPRRFTVYKLLSYGQARKERKEKKNQINKDPHLLCCVVSEALNLTETRTHMHTRPQAAKAEFNPIDYGYRRHRDIYLYVQFTIQRNTSSTVTPTLYFLSLFFFLLARAHAHTHPHTNTLGDNALQWGLRWPKAAKHLSKFFFFPFSKKKEEKKSK